MILRRLEASDVCRWCGDACWLADDTGPGHPCCALWATWEPARPCRACEASRAWRRRNRPNRYHEEP